MEKYYTRQEVRAAVPTMSETTLDRWSLKLRDTSMAVRPGGKRVLFSEDFVSFISSRVDRLGPPDLPGAERIAALYRLWREKDGDVVAIARTLKISVLITQIQLSTVGIDYDERQTDLE